MLKWINPKLALLEEQLRRAEDHKTSLQADNSWLRIQLDEAKTENQKLVEKIFQITGISARSDPSIVNINTQQVPIQGGQRGWARERHDREVAAKLKYWEDKKRQEADRIEALEKEVAEGK